QTLLADRPTQSWPKRCTVLLTSTPWMPKPTVPTIETSPALIRISRRSPEDAFATIEKLPEASPYAVHIWPVVRFTTVAGWFKGDGETPVPGICPATVRGELAAWGPAGGVFTIDVTNS